MNKLYSTEPKKERVILIGTVKPGHSREEAEDTLNELALLAESAGAEVYTRYFQSLKQFDPAFYIGKGKASEIAENIRNSGVDTIIFNGDLTPVQQKNLSELFNKKVIERTGLILEIFAQNARTREAKTQVELAQLEYILPRLTRQWKHLERQVGGIGVRAGMGEKQLEVDRRLTKSRIKKLHQELQELDNQRKTSAKRRKSFFKVTTIGYTNAGKSTLFNTLVPPQPGESGVLVADRLFATLDSTIRRLELTNHQTILLSDTVGFIRKLPHHLIASFRSTLSVVQEANLLLNIVDISRRDYDEQITAVKTVLTEMEITTIPILNVFNKIDLLNNDTDITDARRNNPGAVFISAQRGIGINALLERIAEAAAAYFGEYTFTLPISDMKTIAQLYDTGEVLEQIYDSEYTTVTVRMTPENALRFSVKDRSAFGGKERLEA